MDRAVVARWIQRITLVEGGYSDDPSDPGNWTGGKVGVGELKGTNYGIAANTYGQLDIKGLTLDQAAEIYVRDFLAPLQAELLPPGLVYQLLDFAVNSGAVRAVKGLQRELRIVDDGVIGPATVAAVAARSPSDLIQLLLANRIDYLTELKNWPHAGRGWMKRQARNLRYGAEDS